MIETRTLTIVAVGLVLSAHTLQGQNLSRYRDFQLGVDLSSVSALTKGGVSDAKIIHQRPAVIQEVAWQLPYFVNGSTTLQDDPVHQIVFTFYNDQLSKLVVDYDHDRTAGMTDADMIEGISRVYGSPVKPAVTRTRALTSQVDGEPGTPVARWGDIDSSVVLYRSSYASGFRMIVTSRRLDALAQAADAEALRLDAREAPEREIARQKKDLEDTRIAQEKARIANKAAFRP